MSGSSVKRTAARPESMARSLSADAGGIRRSDYPPPDPVSEMEAQYRAIFESTSDGVLINDLNGYVVEANPAACRMHGYLPEEFVGLHRSAYIHPDCHHLIPAYLDGIREHGACTVRSTNVHKDGRAFPVEVHGSSFLYKGQPHILGVLRDVTEQVQAYELLEQRVKERTRELAIIAVDYARLYQKAQEIAALEERQRLSRELHDSVSQALFSMTKHSQAAQVSMKREGVDPNGRTARNLQELTELTQGALAEMRALIFELRPGALQEEGLAAALRKHAAALTAREELVVEVEAPDQRLVLDPAAEAHLYRLAQEALHNVVKHAAAGHALVRLEVGAEMITLEVRDDGIGFESDTAFAGHLGLHTMADRAEELGGTLRIRSAVGEGTSLLVSVPCTGAVGATEVHHVR